MSYFDEMLNEHVAVANAAREQLREPFDAMLAAWAAAIRGGGKLIFFGNGGSAADAQHIATELAVRFSVDRAPIPAIALTTDSSALTAAANDLGFEQIFARQLEAIGRPGDLAVGITTSGASPNVLAALDYARRADIVAAALAGKGGGELAGRAAPLIVVPSESTARVQEMHITIGHLLCGALEIELGLTE